MSLSRHDPPGFVDDLTEENRQGWSDLISSFMLTDRVSPTLTPQFYDAVKVIEKNPIATQKVTWIAFPKKIKDQSSNDKQRWTKADADRNVQDEYLEWSIKKDNNGKMLKIVFCNEGPEYFQYLGQTQPETLVKLYQDLNPGFSITAADLFHNVDGKMVYNPTNKWNDSTTTGTIMHLIQINNTLGAEVDLGALATVLRKRKDGTPITDSDELIKCSKYGNPGRNSDPTIGAAINSIARGGPLITIQNPVALYIDGINWGQIETPDGTDPSTFWKWARGQEGTYMRAEFEVPSTKDYVLGDLTVKGLPLEYGGQLADFIKISITGRAMDTEGHNQIPLRLCSEPPPPPSDDIAPAIEVEGSRNAFVSNTLPALANHGHVRT
jgi:hypothetical protein